MVIRKRLDICGSALFFVTTTIVDWKPVFNEPIIARSVLQQLGDSLNYFHVSLAGYVLMPTHLHALLGFPHAEELSRFMQSFKILSSKKVKELPQLARFNFQDARGSFSLWKPRFDDLMITSERQFTVKLNYIHENPVRAGLAALAVDWAYSSAGAWCQNKEGLLPIEKQFKWTR